MEIETYRFIDEMIEKFDSLDIKVLLNGAWLDNRVILNYINMWLEDVDLGWYFYIDYLKSEDWQSDECFKAQSDYYELEPSLQELRKNIKVLLTECASEPNGYLDKEKLNLVDKLDIHTVMKGSICDDLVEKLLTWTNRAMNAHLEEDETSKLTSFKDKLIMIHEVYEAEELEYKMSNLKERWDRVKKLTKKVEITEAAMNPEKVKVTNVVFVK